MKKAKRYAEGGPTAQGTYPFPQSLSGMGNAPPMQPSNTNVFVGGQGTGQPPLGGLPQQPQPQMMKKGGCTKMAKGGGVMDKAPKGQKVPGTKTYHVDEPTKDTPKTKRAAPAASAASGPEGQEVPGTKTFHVNEPYAKGGAVKKMARGGGIEQRGKTRGRMV